MAVKNDLFIDLYRFRQREKRDPLEDWLTECLAAVLRALPVEAQAALFGWLVGAETESVAAAIAEHGAAIETQHITGKVGIPDMLVTLGGHPWILFENKVGHGVAIREREHGEASDHLRDYARWLRAAGGECALLQGIVFITHITPPPEDFRSGAAPEYAGLHRTHTDWGTLGRRIAGLVADLPDGHHARVMSDAFLAYLEHHDMSSELPDASAFAAAQLYLTHAPALENLVSTIWDAVKPMANFGKTRERGLKPEAHQGTVSAWRYLAPTINRDFFLETGVWFPEAGDLYYGDDSFASRPAGPQIFLRFANEHDDSFVSAPAGPEGFVRPHSDFVATKALADFPADPQMRGEQIVAWVAERAGVLKAFLAEHGFIG